MISPLQRLARMHRMFGEDRSVLAADYEYFICSVFPFSRIKLGVSRRNNPRCNPKNGMKRRHRVKAPIEPEHILVKVGARGQATG